MMQTFADKYFLTRSAAQTYFIREHNGKTQILFGRRQGSFGAGEWDVAAGHCEEGESFRETAIREAKEEFDLEFTKNDIVFTTIIHVKNNYQYIDAHFFVKNFAGTPRICECDKCDCMEWFDIDNLPEKIFADRRDAIENYLNKITYSEIGFD